MRAIRRALARLGALLRGHGRADDELRAEMEAHLEMEIEENVRRGMHPAEARRRALIASGGMTQAAERVREQRGLPWVEGLLADARFAARHFRRTPVTTATILLVLSLGIGTNVVVFTILNSLATMPAPGLERVAELVRIRGSEHGPAGGEPRPRLLSWPEVEAYAARSDLFSAVAAYAEESATLDTEAPAPLAVTLIHVTSNYFRVLGITPAIGREPTSEGDDPEAPVVPTATISHALWRQHFGGVSDVLGRTLRIDGQPVEVVGVAPPRFAGTDGGRNLVVWVPLAAYPQLRRRSAGVFSSLDNLFLGAAARLRSDVRTDDASAALVAIAERAFDRHREGIAAGPGGAEARAGEGWGVDVTPMLASNSRVSQRRDMLVSGAAAGALALLVLLVTCANVSALMVGTAVARRKEIGVRLSLGAPRRRLVRQLLTESVLLSLAAAAVGLAVTMIGIRFAGAMLSGVQLVIDTRVTVATTAAALATGLLFGVSPALHATRISLGEVLKGAGSPVGARSWLQSALVVGQIALTQPLLVGLGVVVAATFTESSQAGSGVAGRIAEVELDAWAGRVAPEERESLIAGIVQRVAALPGVVAAMPMQMGRTIVPIAVPPADRVAGVTTNRPMEAHLVAAPEGYFEAFDVPIVLGRDFDGRERVPSPQDDVLPWSNDRVIVGADLARRLFGDADPLGRRLVMEVTAPPGAAPAMVIVGVVDAEAAGPSDVDGRVRVYVPYTPVNTGVIARTAAPALPLLDAMRRAVAAEAPQLPVERVQTMAQREAHARRRVLRAGAAAAGGGVLALLLSAVGLYAVVSAGVGQRRREIGVRTALGAMRGQVVAIFFRRGLILALVGIALGLPIGTIIVRLAAAELGLAPAGSLLLGLGIAGMVLAVASAAVWIPAHRAGSVDPVIALRSD